MNRLIHVKPIVTEQVAIWHRNIMNAMQPGGHDEPCIRRSAARRPEPPQCVRRASFSTPITKTLWRHVQMLMTEQYSARCGSSDDDEDFDEEERSHTTTSCSSGCNGGGGCQAVTCEIADLTNVKSLFRLSEYEYQRKDCRDIFKKFFELRQPRRQRLLRGVLDLKLNQRHRFKVRFDPRQDAATVSFHYKSSGRVRRNRTAGNRSDVRVVLDDVVNMLFDNIQHQKATGGGGGQCRTDAGKRRKRRRSLAPSLTNSLTSVPGCRDCQCYVTGWIQLRHYNVIWDDIRREVKDEKVFGEQALNGDTNTLRLYKKSDVEKLLLQEECAPGTGGSVLRRKEPKAEPGAAVEAELNKSTQRRYAEVFVGRHNPFLVQKHKKKNRFRVKYYARFV